MTINNEIVSIINNLFSYTFNLRTGVIHRDHPTYGYEQYAPGDKGHDALYRQHFAEHDDYSFQW